VRSSVGKADLRNGLYSLMDSGFVITEAVA
jgi:hypothetical protein